MLFWLVAITVRLPLQRKDRVWISFKIPHILFPAYAAFAMLQANKLLFHFSATAWADFVVSPHVILPVKQYSLTLPEALQMSNQPFLLCM